MAKKTIKVHLDSESIDDLITRINKYSEGVRSRAQQFCEELADIGIKVAYANSPLYGEYLTFTKYVTELGATGDNAAVVMYGAKKTDIVKKWFSGGGIETVEIDPLLMEEFGSGYKASNIAKKRNAFKVAGVGRGTFTPNKGHAKDKDWSWTTLDGVHHKFSEETNPGQPLYNARREMKNDIKRVAERVFKDNVV